MFGFRTKDEKPHALDPAIAKILESMETFGPEDDEWPQLMESLERLTKLKDRKERKQVSPDTLAVVVGNLAAVLIVVAYEQKHVITTKAFGLTLKRDP